MSLQLSKMAALHCKDVQQAQPIPAGGHHSPSGEVPLSGREQSGNHLGQDVLTGAPAYHSKLSFARLVRCKRISLHKQIKLLNAVLKKRTVPQHSTECQRVSNINSRVWRRWACRACLLHVCHLLTGRPQLSDLLVKLLQQLD